MLQSRNISFHTAKLSTIMKHYKVMRPGGSCLHLISVLPTDFEQRYTEVQFVHRAAPFIHRGLLHKIKILLTSPITKRPWEKLSNVYQYFPCDHKLNEVLSHADAQMHFTFTVSLYRADSIANKILVHPFNSQQNHPEGASFQMFRIQPGPQTRDDHLWAW
jgi:hypothetical protein